MSVIVAEKLHTAPAGEFAPMLPADVRLALRNDPWALHLYAEAQSKPEGWAMGDRDRMAADMGWPVYRVRRAITGLRRAGLYLVERVQDLGGRWSTVCRFVASVTSAVSAQVTPKADIPKDGLPTGTPPSRERKREGRTVHSPATCKREAAGLPCRQCATVAAAESRPENRCAPTHPAERPVADVLGDRQQAAAYIPWRERVTLRR